MQIKRDVTSRDFINTFRRYDPRCLVPDELSELLDRIQVSIRRESLLQARNSTHLTTRDQFIVLKYPNPTHLTYCSQSESIMVAFPELTHGSPSIYMATNSSSTCLTLFTHSVEASFHITSTALGFKTVSFSRSGPSTLLCLPLSSPIVIKRSFMHNTFQVAFMGPPELEAPMHVQRG